MKLLCNTYEYPPIGGGGSKVARSLAISLAGRGHDVDVVTSQMADLQTSERIAGVSIERVPCWRRHRHYSTLLELASGVMPIYRRALELTARNNYDLNHTHFAVPSGISSYLLYRKTGLPYVVTIHGSDIPGYNPDRFSLAHLLVRPLWRRVLLNSAAVISPSEFLKTLLHRHLDLPVHVIPNGFDLPESAIATTEKKDRILLVTRLFPRKGVHHFLEALETLDSHWEVVIVGDGPHLGQLRDQVSKSGVQVRFTGFVQGQDLLNLYSSAKIFVFPSIQENFPIVLLEAMAAGCAIVTTSAEGCAEVVGDAGITVDPARPDRIGSALVELMQEKDKLNELAIRGKERVKRFSWENIGAEYDEVLQAVANIPRSKPNGPS